MTDGQPVSSCVNPQEGPKTRCLLLSDSCCFVDVGWPLWGEDGYGTSVYTVWMSCLLCLDLKETLHYLLLPFKLKEMISTGITIFTKINRFKNWKMANMQAAWWSIRPDLFLKKEKWSKNKYTSGQSKVYLNKWTTNCFDYNLVGKMYILSHCEKITKKSLIL
jgi:hypothetical protein